MRKHLKTIKPSKHNPEAYMTGGKVCKEFFFMLQIKFQVSSPVEYLTYNLAKLNLQVDNQVYSKFEQIPIQM